MTGCSDTTPAIIAACSDPAYRLAHPDECAGFAVLILQPEYSLTEPGETVQYIVILQANGKQITLTQGLIFTSSNIGVAEINADGLATGVTSGIASIGVTWQDLSAHAQLEVVASCAETNQHFALLIDNSRTMGQSFSALHSTKLAFSKSIAADFVETVNFTKDDVSAWKFSDDSDQLIDFGTDATAARTAIQGVAISSAHSSNLADSLQDAIDDFPATGVKVLVLFTDGEYSGSDPRPIAQAFKESGGFLVIVATRGWGTFFQVLAEMASGGFFLSAYDDTEDDILDSLSGLKSFICSGGCSPEQIAVPYAELNYTGFINWTVSNGCVDLVGLDRWDVRPNNGNGLYVDLTGTTDSTGYVAGLGQLTSIVEYDFEDGKDYRFEIFVAGSTANSQAGTWTIRVRVGDGVDELITITNGATPFAAHEFTWTQVGDLTGPIIIEQTVKSGHPNVGTLIDEITLENVTDVDVMLYDNFDEENPTIPPPNPGGYGCLSAPPGSQQADPTPPIRMVE